MNDLNGQVTSLLHKNSPICSPYPCIPEPWHPGSLLPSPCSCALLSSLPPTVRGQNLGSVYKTQVTNGIHCCRINTFSRVCPLFVGRQALRQSISQYLLLADSQNSKKPGFNFPSLWVSKETSPIMKDMLCQGCALHTHPVCSCIPAHTQCVSVQPVSMPPHGSLNYLLPGCPLHWLGSYSHKALQGQSRADGKGISPHQLWLSPCFTRTVANTGHLQ